MKTLTEMIDEYITAQRHVAQRFYDLSHRQIGFQYFDPLKNKPIKGMIGLATYKNWLLVTFDNQESASEFFDLRIKDTL
jgi:hypothetical protein